MDNNQRHKDLIGFLIAETTRQMERRGMPVDRNNVLFHIEQSLTENFPAVMYQHLNGL